MEAQSSTTLALNDQVSLKQIFTSLGNLIQRLKSSSFSLPPIEAIVEVLLTKTDAQDEIKEIPLILISDVTEYFKGNTISYVEFS